MMDKPQDHTQGVSTWRRYGLEEHSPVEASLPIVENSITQMAPGPSETGATIVTNGYVTVAHSLIRPCSVGVLILKDGDTGFFFPRRWVGELRVNGVVAEPDVIHLPVEGVTYYVRGQEREILGSILPRARFIETVAALRGVDPDKEKLHEGALGLGPVASRIVHRGLASIVRRVPEGDGASTLRCSSFDFTNKVFKLMLDTYLYARPEQTNKSGRVHNPGWIVRVAEERFASAMNGPVSLADLCQATGVSKSALYLAFQQWCGEPPITYFHKRRLSKARTRLLNTNFRRGAVKHAVLSVGLTELGRFSREYMQIFGEQPSITISRSVISPFSNESLAEG